MGDAMDKGERCGGCYHKGTPITSKPCCDCVDGMGFGERYFGIINPVHNVLREVKEDAVNNPPHYTDHPSGIECIQITEHMNFCLGNAIKYLWRAGLKGDAVEDMEKAVWYINREIERRKAYGDDDTTA